MRRLHENDGEGDGIERRRAQICVVGTEAEELGRHKETHLKERGKSGQHNVTQFLGKESFKKDGVYRIRKKRRPLHVATEELWVTLKKIISGKY